MTTYVNDYHGNRVDFEAASALMDGDICEEIIHEGGCDTDQQFFDEYARKHSEKHNEEFAPYFNHAW